MRFDFAGDNTADWLPRCEMTGVVSDVHLVVYGEGAGTVARLLGPELRFVLQREHSGQQETLPLWAGEDCLPL